MPRMELYWEKLTDTEEIAMVLYIRRDGIKKNERQTASLLEMEARSTIHKYLKQAHFPFREVQGKWGSPALPQDRVRIWPRHHFFSYKGRIDQERLDSLVDQLQQKGIQAQELSLKSLRVYLPLYSPNAVYQ